MEKTPAPSTTWGDEEARFSNPFGACHCGGLAAATKGLPWLSQGMAPKKTKANGIALAVDYGIAGKGMLAMSSQ